MADVEVFLARTRTGKVIDELSFTSWSWSNSVHWESPGSASVTVPLTGRDAPGRATLSYLRAIKRSPWGYSIIIRRDGRTEWAGPATSLGWSREEVSVSCASIVALLDRRLILTDGYRDKPFRYEANVDLDLPTRDVVLKLLALSVEGVGRDLPFTFDGLSGLIGQRTSFLGSDLKTVQEGIKDAVDKDDGPDVLVLPQYTDSAGLSWSFRVGSPKIGSTTPTATFDVPGSILQMSGEVDLSEAVTSGYVAGDSSGSSRLIGVSITPVGPNDIALERVDRTSSSETKQAALDSLAKSYTNAFTDGTQSWTLTADPDLSPVYGVDWSLGDQAVISVSDHPWVEDGDYLRRIEEASMSVDSLGLTTTSVAQFGEREVPE